MGTKKFAVLSARIGSAVTLGLFFEALGLYGLRPHIYGPVEVSLKSDGFSVKLHVRQSGLRDLNNLTTSGHTGIKHLEALEITNAP